MKHLKLLIFLSIITISCSPLKPPTVISNDDIRNYKYIIVPENSNKIAGSGSIGGGGNIVYGGSSSKSINPSNIISGTLIKEGFTQLHEINPELADQTLIVNYGESGTRNRGLGYTIEVTMQFISARSNTVISTCSAEGQGDTEVDDIRQAIGRCLKALLQKSN